MSPSRCTANCTSWQASGSSRRGCRVTGSSVAGSANRKQRAPSAPAASRNSNRPAGPPHPHPPPVPAVPRRLGQRRTAWRRPRRRSGPIVAPGRKSAATAGGGSNSRRPPSAGLGRVKSMVSSLLVVRPTVDGRLEIRCAATHVSRRWIVALPLAVAVTWRRSGSSRRFALLDGER